MDVVHSQGMKELFQKFFLLIIMPFAVSTLCAQSLQEVVDLKKNYIHELDEIFEIPLFFHVRSEFLDNYISPFADLKIGYAFPIKEGAISVLPSAAVLILENEGKSVWTSDIPCIG